MVSVEPSRRHAPRVRGSRRRLLRAQRRRRRCRACSCAIDSIRRDQRSSTATCIRGTARAAIFRQRARRCITFSLHGDKNYPFRKEVSDRRRHASATAPPTPSISRRCGSHLPWRARPSPARSASSIWRARIRYEGDRLGRLKLTIGRPARRATAWCFDACRPRASRSAIAMSGGYATDVDAIVTIHANTIRSVASCISLMANPLSPADRVRRQVGRSTMGDLIDTMASALERVLDAGRSISRCEP